MSQFGELAKVKARIKALAEKTVSNGCTEAEALAAAEMVGRLLERYALTMEDIEVREARCVQVRVPVGGARRRPVDLCVPAISRFCDCRVWLAREPPPVCYVFFGIEADTALAGYLFAVIDRAVHTELAGFRRAHGGLRGTALRLASTSFQQGMALRIGERLDEMRRQREEAVAAQRPTGTALVLAKRQVVEAAFREAEVRLVSSGRQIRMRQGAAFRHGRAAAERVNLGRPVEGQAPDLIG